MDFLVPELGEGVYEAELVSWLVKAGDPVKRGQSLAEVLTDKATMEVPSPFAGTVTALHAEQGAQIKVGQKLLAYDPAGRAAAESPAAPPEKAAKQETKAPTPVPAARAEANGPSGRVQVKAAPSVRYMARKLGIDLAAVHGSGPEGRVLLDDLTSAIGERAAPAGKPERRTPKADYGKPGTRVKLQGLRRTIAERTVRAKHTAPHYGYVDECDVTDLVKMRASLKETAAKAGAKLTYLAFVVKAVAAALKEVPVVNASLDDAAGEIVLHDRYHIGVAVAAPQGLLVPVVRDADRKTVFEIARDVERLGAEARDGKSRREDLTGSTFTVTSIGSIGGLFSTPVINHPEVGILGVGKVVKRPVFDEAGSVRPADMVYLSFSFDHRVVDGAVGAVFGNAVARLLQNPALLLVS